jgi:hypothetical protein
VTLGDLWHDGGGERLYRGTTLSAPGSADDTLTVLVQTDAGVLRREASGWSPKPGPAYPPAGVECLIAFDHEDQAWVVEWAGGGDVDAGSPPTVGVPLFIQASTPSYSAGPYLWLKDTGGGVYVPMIGP